MKFTLLVRYSCLLILFFCLTWQVNASPADDFLLRLESSNSSSATDTSQLPLNAPASTSPGVASGSTPPPRVTSDQKPVTSYQNQSGAAENLSEKQSTNQSAQQDNNAKEEDKEENDIASTNLFQDATYENFLPQEDSICFDKNYLERET